MNPHLRLRKAVVLLCCVALLLQPRPARASITSDVVWVFVAVAVAGAGVGVGVYYLVRKPPTATGCVAATSDGLELTDDGSHQVFRLIGNIADLHPGDRLRLAGKRSRTSTGTRQLLVEKLAKDYGPCKLTHP